MPSEYYKWIVRDVKQVESREMTSKEKWNNWWHYHWWHVLICVFAVVAVIGIASDIIDAQNSRPDCLVTYIGTQKLPTDTVTALEEQLGALIGDTDKNGNTIITIQQYILDPNSEYYACSDPNEQVAFVTHLSTQKSFIYILEDPMAFQERFGLLTFADGTPTHERPDDVAPIWHSWAACPVIAALPLGEYAFESDSGISFTGNNQDLLAELYIGRGAVRDCSKEEETILTEIWSSIIAGAKDTR